MGNSDSKKIDKKIVGYKVVSDDAKAEPITEADSNIIPVSYTHLTLPTNREV